MSNSKIDLIKQAIQSQSKLIVSFDTRAGVRNDVIMPLRWTSSGELCAFSHEANGEIFINPSVIHKCAVYEATLEGTEPSLVEPMTRSVQTSPFSPAPVIHSSAEVQTASSNIPASSPRLSRKKLPSETVSIAGIEDVKSREDWRYLLNFYRECLIHENRQEY
ncbi:MAG TPA: hypothetical protein PLL95_19020, partial [Anaerolineales bacterium]|nr:hypothetical protein [Anaerolineales bacterium]